jgi:hypothetical protein
VDAAGLPGPVRAVELWFPVILDSLKSQTSSSIPLGSFTLSTLMERVTGGAVSGIAHAEERSREMYLLFLTGEPAGAIYSDENGMLFGDKAVLRIEEGERFSLFPADPAMLGEIVAGCRIHDPTHLKRHLAEEIPEIGKRSAPTGVLTLIIVRSRVPQPGVHVSVRRGRQVMGSAVTTPDGTAVFRLIAGAYECVILDSNQQMTTYPVHFTGPSECVTVEIRGA